MSLWRQFFHRLRKTSLETNSFSLNDVFYLSAIYALLKMKDMEVQQKEHSQSLSVNQELRVMTSLYLERHPGLTLNALAQRSGVPATTMRRLMQEEGRNELAPHSVLALVSYLLKEKKISKILKIVQGPIAELLNKCFDQFIFDEDSSNHEMHADLNTLLQDKTTYLVYKLAANKFGTDINEVKDALGLLGLKKLNELTELNWIMADETGKLHAKEKNFSVDLAIAHQLTHALVDQYKPCDVKLGYNLFYSLSEGMTEEGIKKIKEIEKEAVKKIFDLMNNQIYQGNIPYFAVVLSDIIGPTPHQIEMKGAIQ